MLEEIQVAGLRIPVPEGKSPSEVYWQHARFAISEGFCPHCNPPTRLDPETSICPGCLFYWFSNEHEVGWERAYEPVRRHPFDG